MIAVDRESPVPVQTQVADQLRYQIATGRYRIGARLPSTRALAAQLDISYHTVRAAYRKLEQEGLIEGRTGSGFEVLERSSVPRGKRMEEGAAVFQDALRRLVGMGLASDEIEYLFQEQVEFVSGEQEQRKLLFAAPSLEVAEMCASQVSAAFQQPVEAATIDALPQHGDADFIFAAFEHVRKIMALAPRADVRGLVVHLNAEALERIVRLMDEDTLCVVARTEQAVPSLIAAVRAEAGFGGQMLAFSSDADTAELRRLVEQASLVAYTPAARRSLLPLLRNQNAHVSVRSVVSLTGLEVVRGR